MVSRFLILTAFEKPWPSGKIPLVFLGEWCKLYNRKKEWEDREVSVLPYHWDDRKKLYNDYIYLQKVYEELLAELSYNLNVIHKVNHSDRYWRIVVGPWLGYFIQLLFDRWTMIEVALKSDNISTIDVFDFNESNFIPNDMMHFIQALLMDSWNEFIYTSILDWMKAPLKKIDLRNNENISSGNVYKFNFRCLLKRNLTQTVNYFNNLFCGDNEHFFISTYLSKKQDITLQLKLNQIPKLWKSVSGPVVPVDIDSRKWTLENLGSKSDFLNFVRTLIPKQIPVSYLEGYHEIVILTKKLPWPKNPKTIFTSQDNLTSDVFKIWAAEKCEKGSPLITSQHGGNYGTALWNFLEDHQIAISDHFLTWGWSKSTNDKVIPIGNFKGFGKSYSPKKGGFALLVEAALPRQSYFMFSAPVGVGQWCDYFNDQCRFIQALPIKLREEITVRLYPEDFECGQKDRWLDRFPLINIDQGQPIHSLLRKSRLFIGTYNATSYLEAMSLNFPTIIFWNPKHWELRNSAIPFFTSLRLAGIFHNTPESAALKMSEIWNNVEGWWFSKEVQSAREEFCNYYAQIPKKPLNIMKDLFNEITIK